MTGSYIRKDGHKMNSHRNIFLSPQEQFKASHSNIKQEFHEIRKQKIHGDVQSIQKWKKQPIP